MLTRELAERQQGSIEVGVKEREADPFVFSIQMIRDLKLMSFARAVLGVVGQLRLNRPALPVRPGGRPLEYRDESIWVTLLVMMVWQLSPEAMVKRMQRWSELAQACGYGPGQVISASQLRRRRDSLGLWVYFITFWALVWVLIGRGVLLGRDWVIDATIIDAFSCLDKQAGWSFTKHFGYKATCSSVVTVYSPSCCWYRLPIAMMHLGLSP